MTRATYALALALAGCGGAMHETSTAAEPAHAESWSTQTCVAPTVVRTETDGARRFVVTSRDRFAIDASGTRRATTVPRDPFLVAQHFGGVDGPWSFVTDHGVVLRSDDFLGSLTVVGTIPEGSEEVRSRGNGHLFARYGRDRFLLDETGMRPLPLPPGRVVIAAAIDWPGTLVVLAEPGELLVSHDRGASFASIATDGELPIDVEIDDDGIRVTFAGQTLATLGEGDALGDPRSVDEQYEREYEARDDAYEGEGESESESEAPQAQIPLDPYCSSLPPDVIAQWEPTSAPPWSEDELDLPERCQPAIGLSAVVAYCAALHPRQNATVELLWLDPARGTFRSLGILAGASQAGGMDAPVGSSSGRTFVLGYYDSLHAHDSVYFDGEQLVPMTLGARRHPIAVHDALALVLVEDDARHVELVHLPDAAPVSLELPAGLRARWGTIASDGTLAIVAGADDAAESDPQALFVGHPGQWTRGNIDATLASLAMADARHGLATLEGSSATTDDGGQTWAPVPLDHQYGHPPQCTSDVCTIAQTAVFRRAEGEQRTIVETPSAGRPTSESVYLSDWSCTAPATPLEPATDDPVLSCANGFVHVGDHDPADVAWSGIDARGAFHATGRTSGGRAYGLLAVTRSFAVLSTQGGIVVASSSPHALGDSDVSFQSPSASAYTLADGGALVIVDEQLGNAGHSAWVVRLDADGDAIASRTLVLRASHVTGAAMGPDGLVGIAVGDDFATPRAWTVYPIGDGAPVEIDFPIERAASACTGETPWTIAAPYPGVSIAVETRVPASDAQFVFGVGAGPVCLHAVFGGGAARETGLPTLFADHGAMRSNLLDDPARAVPITCTASDR